MDISPSRNNSERQIQKYNDLFTNGCLFIGIAERSWFAAIACALCLHANVHTVIGFRVFSYVLYKRKHVSHAHTHSHTFEMTKPLKCSCRFAAIARTYYILLHHTTRICRRLVVIFLCSGLKYGLNASSNDFRCLYFSSCEYSLADSCVHWYVDVITNVVKLINT